MDLIGQRFGRLVVIEQGVDSNRTNNRAYCICSCDCGEGKRVLTHNLKKGVTRSCGCLGKEAYSATGKKNAKSLIGQRFGRLIPVERFRENRNTYYMCQCDCGTQTRVSHANLHSGASLCCGCRMLDLLEARNKPLKDVITNQVFNYYRRNAKMRGIPWDLPKLEFQTLIFSPCYYCGVIAGTSTRTHSSRGRKSCRSLPNNGVDRFDNNQGYNGSNCVPCCKGCNSAKSDLPFQEFKEWALRLAAHLKAVE